MDKKYFFIVCVLISGIGLINYLDNKLGKESTFKDMVEDFIKSVGIKETQDILEGLKKASELVGRKVTDVSNLLSPVRSFVDFHKSLISNIFIPSPFLIH